MNSVEHSFISSGYDLTLEFGYNPAGQMISQHLSNGRYHHPAPGSRTGTYQANGLNQYTQVGGQTITHDARGNLTFDGESNFQYDVENRLTDVEGIYNATLEYDPMGRLHQLTIDGDTTQFLYDGDTLIGEYRSGILQKRYVHGPGMDRPVVSYSGSGVATSDRSYLHANHQGSVIAVTDSGGVVTQVNTYDSYGSPGDDNLGRFGYTGQMYLPELGLYHYRARVYHPKLGRFLQTDPIGYADQMNLYAYVHNDPLNFVDPTGMTTDDILVTGTACGCSIFRDALMDLVIRGPGEVRESIQSSVRDRVFLAKVGVALISDLLSESKDRTETTPDTAPDKWEKIPGSKGAYRPIGKKEPIFEKDRAGERSHGGSRWKKWDKRNDWEKGKDRNGTYDDTGKRLRD